MIISKDTKYYCRDTKVRDYLIPTRVVSVSQGGLRPSNVECLLAPESLQPYVHFSNPGCLIPVGGFILLDFGREIAGGVRIVSGRNKHGVTRIRIRFGESVSEALLLPNNDHAMHDTHIDLPPMGATEYGNTGFRFVCIDLPDDSRGEGLELLSVSAIAVHRGLVASGSFVSSDERLNRIWETGVYTVYLNMQDYIYDGIKRDRLVWMGDMHPEIKVIGTAFDDSDCVMKSLDFMRDHTPQGRFMNTIPSYSLWWLISQYEWHMLRGDRQYLEAQREYMLALIDMIIEFVDDDGREHLPEWRFIDWPTQGNDKAINAGLHGLTAWALKAGAELCRYLEKSQHAMTCVKLHEKMRHHSPDAVMIKQAQALKVIGGIDDPEQANREVLSASPCSGLSTFMGYYILRARSEGGDNTGALDTARRYWGGMLDFGATTFWEDFDLEWTKNAGRIDELPVSGKSDLHADFGAHCYKGLRHSLCHGWAGGVSAWLSEYILGIRPLQPGYATALIAPKLGDLEWLEGCVPTPHGKISLRAERKADGTCSFEYDAPSGMRIETQMEL